MKLFIPYKNMDEVLRADLLKRAQEWYRKWENTPIPAFKGDICASKEVLTKNVETKFTTLPIRTRSKLLKMSGNLLS